MTKAVYIVYSRPSSPEREDEYNDWYDNVHLGEVCAVPGVVSAQRYRLAEGMPAGDDAYPYFAVYQIDSDNPADTVTAIGKGVANGTIRMTDAIQLKPLPPSALYIER